MRALFLACAVGLASLTWVGIMPAQAKADSDPGLHRADTTRVDWRRGTHWRGRWNNWHRGTHYRPWRGYYTPFYNSFYYPTYRSWYYPGYRNFYYPGYRSFYYPGYATYYTRPFGFYGALYF